MKAMSIAALVSLAGFATSAAAQECEWSKGCTASEAQVATVQTVSMEQGDTIVDVAVSAGSFNTLVAAVKAAGLVEALSGEGPFTVFAPTDEAFAKLPAGTIETLLKPENKKLLTSILTYHVVKGEAMAKDVVSQKQWTTLSGQRIDVKAYGNDVKIDKAKVVKTNIEASNGVIHVIDTVIMPETKNIVEVAQGAGKFGTLLAAAKAAGLADLLMSDGPFTVFAPTDDAFAALPEGTVESLLRPENKDKLANILKYHVVPGRIYSDQAIKAGRAETALGQTIDISAANGAVMVEDAKVLTPDIEASNGVVHVIDRVILPE
ncbi:MAG: fasciclin domain-containing protein [Phycisphaerales bacterium JB039]